MRPDNDWKWRVTILGLALWWAGGAFAAEEVEVAAVRFSSLRMAHPSGGGWLEATVVLQAHPAQDRVGRMVPRVKVALLLGFETATMVGGVRRVEHYQASAECVALEAGRSDVRFYLPPEIVKRDQVHGDPKYWGVELAVAGRAVPAGKFAYAGALSGVEARRNFQKQGAAAAAANDGILLPQYLTPFANEYPRETPSFIRK